MKCQNDGKYFHGSLERAASHQHCPVKFGTGAKTSLNQYHGFGIRLLLGVLLPLSFLGNVNAKSVCRVNMLWGTDGPAVLFSSEKGMPFVYSLF